MDYNTLVEEEERPQLSRVPLTALYEALKQVKDGRKKRGCRYSLAVILSLLLMARLAGETDIRAAAHWIKLRKKWVIEQLGLTRESVPCLGTYLYALSKIDAQDLLNVVASCQRPRGKRESDVRRSQAVWPNKGGSRKSSM